MNKYKRPKFAEADLKINPFTYSLEIPIVKFEDLSRYKKDQDGDLLHDIATIEYEKSVKVYVSSARRKVINILNPNTCKLLSWVEQELDENKDYFWLNKQRYMDETGVAYNTYKKSVKELQTYNFIQPTTINDIFWINPYFFFFGNRVKKYPNNLVIKQDRTD